MSHSLSHSKTQGRLSVVLAVLAACALLILLLLTAIIPVDLGGWSHAQAARPWQHVEFEDHEKRREYVAYGAAHGLILSPALTPTPGCGLAWRHVVSPNPSASSADLFGVAVVASDDAWAVDISHENPGRALTMRWDGNQWNIVPNPNIGTDVNLLDEVTALSADDVWAVGYYSNSGGPKQTLVEHWDGEEWSVIPSPNVLTIANVLRDVDATAPNDVWAVGYYSAPGVRPAEERPWSSTGTALSGVLFPALILARKLMNLRAYQHCLPTTCGL